jgi:hypothetical protein
MDAKRIEIHACVVDAADGKRRLFTILSPDDLTEGISPQAIVGRSIDPRGPIRPENFAPNPVFVSLLHRVVRQWGPESPALQQAALRRGNGFVLVVDLRSPNPHGPAALEDVIGRFEVEGGKILADSYRDAPEHRLLTDSGFFQLDPLIETKLYEAVLCWQVLISLET